MDAVERKTRSFGEVFFFEIYASHSISASGYLPLMPFLHDRISHASKGNTRRLFNFLISAISTTPFHQLKHHDSISQPHLLPTLNDSASTIPFLLAVRLLLLVIISPIKLFDREIWHGGSIPPVARVRKTITSATRETLPYLNLPHRDICSPGRSCEDMP